MQSQKRIPKFIIALFLLLVCAFLLLSLHKINPSLFVFFKTTSAKVEQTDSTPPLITCNIQTKTVLPGEVLSIDKLGVRATDESEIKSIAFTKMDDIEFFSQEFSFSYGGTYTLTITATDIHQNASELVLTIHVETPPEIESPDDFYVAAGSNIDFSHFVHASDLLDSSFSFDDLDIDTSNLNIAKEGNYIVTFSGTDSYGLTATKTATIHVLTKEDLQKQIDSQNINISDSAIIGATNAYDIGSYANSSALESAILPALVEISNEKNDTTSDGCIIKIDSDFVTIATKESIVRDNLTVCISFFDESIRHAAVVFTNTEYDLAFIRLPVNGASPDASVTSEYTRSLRTVHLDEEQWKMHPVTNQISLEQMLRHYELVFKYKLQGK